MRTQTITVDANHAAVNHCYGWCLSEDSGATAEVTLRAGADDGKVIVGPIHLAADETAVIVLPKAVFWEFAGGCWVNEESGSVEGVLYY